MASELLDVEGHSHGSDDFLTAASATGIAAMLLIVIAAPSSVAATLSSLIKTPSIIRRIVQNRAIVTERRQAKKF